MSQHRFFSRLYLYAAVIVLPVVAVIVYATSPSKESASAPTAAVKSAQANINPPVVRVESLTDGQGDSGNLKPLGDSIARYLTGRAPGSSVYIEDLGPRAAVHVGETKAYNIKSLMKLPLTMSLYKARELGRLDTETPVTVKEEHLNNIFGDLWRKGAGYSLTLHEAARLALQRSDNTAIFLINDHVNDVMKPQERAYRQTNMDVQIQENGDAYVTTQSYANVLRCLHEACYLNRQDSDEVLNILKQSIFTAPMKRLPQGIQVAHKIGTNGQAGFNDCGIVYGPKSPFIFCIMLGVGLPQADTDVANVTRMAYDYLQK